MDEVIDMKKEVRKARQFSIYETYVFVQTNFNFYNGYIKQVIDDDTFIFIDDIIPLPFPISFSDLKYPIVPSIKAKR